jgi:hypothetical protein
LDVDDVGSGEGELAKARNEPRRRAETGAAASTSAKRLRFSPGLLSRADPGKTVPFGLSTGMINFELIASDCL